MKRRRSMHSCSSRWWPYCRCLWPVRFGWPRRRGTVTAAPVRPIKYPESKTVETVDDYFGTKVADPYRWLENNDSPEVAAWVEAQNKVTFAYLDQIPYRRQVKARLTKLFNYPQYSRHSDRGEYVLLHQRTTACKTRVSITFKRAERHSGSLARSEQVFRRTARRGWALSRCQKMASISRYGISKGGSDWNDVHVMEVATQEAAVRSN